MSCYFRHMKDILSEAGIKLTPENKREIDRAIHEIVGVEYKDCPNTWKAIKQQFLTNDKKRQHLIRKLKNAVA